jgi:hypothetical protein
MSYNPVTDFLALIRRTSNGARVAEIPGLDFALAAMARAGIFLLSVGQVAPTSNQTVTVWLQPALQSWTAEGTVFLWNAVTAVYEPATPAFWAALLTASAAQVVQDVTTPGPVNVLTNARVVRVLAGPITLVMPLAASKSGDVLISDWTANAEITVQRSGADVFPLAATSWIIGAGGSLCFRPVPGGYVV